MRAFHPSPLLALTLSFVACSDPPAAAIDMSSGGSGGEGSGNPSSGGAGGVGTQFGEPMNPDLAGYPVVDRFSKAAATFLVRADNDALPPADEPIDYDQPPFITTGLGPEGEIVKYYNFDVQPNIPAPIYVLVREGEDVQVEDQPNLVDVIPGAPGYSDFWRVHRVTVPTDYVANTITSVDEVLEAELEIEITDTVVNCPVVPVGSSAELRGGGESNELTRGWYKDQIIYYFNFFEADLIVTSGGKVPTSALYASYNVNPDEPGGGPSSGSMTEDGSDQTHDVVETLPSDAAYSPLRSLSAYDNAEFGDVSDLETAESASAIDWEGALVNYPVVSVE
jgi:hypothetical protein